MDSHRSSLAVRCAWCKYHTRKNNGWPPMKLNGKPFRQRCAVRDYIRKQLCCSFCFQRASSQLQCFLIWEFGLDSCYGSQMYLAWELSSTTIKYGEGDESNKHCLPSLTIDRLEHALRQWKRTWKATRESSIHPQSSYGPLGFNSTALFRIACIRLHFNLGPHLKLETRDPQTIAEAVRRAPASCPYAETTQYYYSKCSLSKDTNPAGCGICGKDSNSNVEHHSYLVQR
jgi:hypothetical protein